MQNDPSNLENLIMPSNEAASTEQKLNLTEKAIEVASSQTVIRDLLSVTLGNIFAFFALLFPPLIVSTLELSARARGLNKNSDKKPT